MSSRRSPILRLRETLPPSGAAAHVRDRLTNGALSCVRCNAEILRAALVVHVSEESQPQPKAQQPTRRTGHSRPYQRHFGRHVPHLSLKIKRRGLEQPEKNIDAQIQMVNAAFERQFARKKGIRTTLRIPMAAARKWISPTRVTRQAPGARVSHVRQRERCWRVIRCSQLQERPDWRFAPLTPTTTGHSSAPCARPPIRHRPPGSCWTPPTTSGPGQSRYGPALSKSSSTRSSRPQRWLRSTSRRRWLPLVLCPLRSPRWWPERSPGSRPTGFRSCCCSTSRSGSTRRRWPQGWRRVRRVRSGWPGC